jgi:hypothetical protein
MSIDKIGGVVTAPVAASAPIAPAAARNDHDGDNTGGAAAVRSAPLTGQGTVVDTNAENRLADLA